MYLRLMYDQTVGDAVESRRVESRISNRSAKPQPFFGTTRVVESDGARSHFGTTIHILCKQISVWRMRCGKRAIVAIQIIHQQDVAHANLQFMLDAKRLFAGRSQQHHARRIFVDSLRPQRPCHQARNQYENHFFHQLLGCKDSKKSVTRCVLPQILPQITNITDFFVSLQFGIESA